MYDYDCHIQLLSGGLQDFDVDDLRNNTKYTGGYTESSRSVKLFWEVYIHLNSFFFLLMLSETSSAKLCIGRTYKLICGYQLDFRLCWSLKIT